MTQKAISGWALAKVNDPALKGGAVFSSILFHQTIGKGQYKNIITFVKIAGQILMKRYCGGLSSRASKYQALTKSNNFRKNEQENVGRFYTVGRIDKKMATNLPLERTEKGNYKFYNRGCQYVGLILHSGKWISCKEQGAASVRLDPLDRRVPYVFAFSS